MVSNIKFAQCHLRLCEIFGVESSDMTNFGGINLLLLGDLLQVSENSIRNYIFVINL